MTYLKTISFTQCFIGGALLLTLASRQSKKLTITKDNFEADTLNAIWRSDKFIQGAFEIQSKVVRTGKKAAEFTLNEGDQIDEERGTVFERAEETELQIGKLRS